MFGITDYVRELTQEISNLKTVLGSDNYKKEYGLLGRYERLITQLSIDLSDSNNKVLQLIKAIETQEQRDQLVKQYNELQSNFIFFPVAPKDKPVIYLKKFTLGGLLSWTYTPEESREEEKTVYSIQEFIDKEINPKIVEKHKKECKPVKRRKKK